MYPIKGSSLAHKPSQHRAPNPSPQIEIIGHRRFISFRPYFYVRLSKDHQTSSIFNTKHLSPCPREAIGIKHIICAIKHFIYAIKHGGQSNFHLGVAPLTSARTQYPQYGYTSTVLGHGRTSSSPSTRTSITMDVNEDISLAVWTTVLCLLICATAARLWFNAPVGPGPAPSSPARFASDSTRSTGQGVRLNQVNKDNEDTVIDIIAIHGLDTKSPDTWTWRDRRNPNVSVNWLADLLPVDVEKARIFTLDWPANLLQPSELVPKLHD